MTGHISRLRVAVCGAGVGGLTCALVLSKYSDIELDVYEATPHFGEIGVGIGIWPRTWELLKRLGLDHELATVCPDRPTDEDVVSFTIRKSDQPEGQDFHQLVTRGRLMTIHRADFHRILLEHLPDTCRKHSSKRLRSYSQPQSGPIELSFADESTATCDVLLGADGIRSAVRSCLLQDKAQAAKAAGNILEEQELLAAIKPAWSGSIAYRYLIPAERLKAKAPGHRVLTEHMLYTGQKAHVVSYPVSSGKMVNVAAFRNRHDLANTVFDGPWVENAVDDEFQLSYSGWEPAVQQLLECGEKPLKWAIHVCRPLQSFVSGRVALLGDAAHAMSPNQGSGAGQAVEDAYIIATVLGNPLTTIDKVPRALQIFDDIRRPFANDIARRSLRNSELFSLEYDDFDFQNCCEEDKKAKLKDLGTEIGAQWEWAWGTTLDGALEEATRRLENL